MTDNRGGMGRDCFDLFGGNKIEDGTGRDGKMAAKLVGGTGRWAHNVSTGRNGKFQQGRFSRRDRTIKYNEFFFPWRDGTVNDFFRDGAGR